MLLQTEGPNLFGNGCLLNLDVVSIEGVSTTFPCLGFDFLKNFPCCGKRTSRLDEVPRKSRPEKMPTKPGDMLQRHSFNQSRKISVPIRRWLEIKLYKLTLDEHRT